MWMSDSHQVVNHFIVIPSLLFVDIDISSSLRPLALDSSASSLTGQLGTADIDTGRYCFQMELFFKFDISCVVAQREGVIP